MKNLKSFFIIFILVYNLNATDKATKAIQGTGDILQFLPAFAAIYSLAIKDYEGLKELAIGFGSTMAGVLIIKQGLNAIGGKNPDYVRFAERPNHSNFQGFPSGHTASAFSAVGFLQKRYGWKFGLPTALLATFVAYSRVKASKHTPFQVVAGGMLGFTINYLVSSKYIDPSKHQIAFEKQEDIRNRSTYFLRYSRRF